MQCSKATKAREKRRPADETSSTQTCDAFSSLRFANLSSTRRSLFVTLPRLPWLLQWWWSGRFGFRTTDTLEGALVAPLDDETHRISSIVQRIRIFVRLPIRDLHLHRSTIAFDDLALRVGMSLMNTLTHIHIHTYWHYHYIWSPVAHATKNNLWNVSTTLIFLFDNGHTYFKICFSFRKKLSSPRWNFPWIFYVKSKCLLLCQVRSNQCTLKGIQGE